MTDTPVWINDVGYSLLSGFIGSPLTSKNLSAIGSGRPSFGFPRPSKTLPSSSCETGISIVLPRNFAFVPVIYSFDFDQLIKRHLGDAVNYHQRALELGYLCIFYSKRCSCHLRQLPPLPSSLSLLLHPLLLRLRPYEIVRLSACLARQIC